MEGEGGAGGWIGLVGIVVVGLRRYVGDRRWEMGDGGWRCDEALVLVLMLVMVLVMRGVCVFAPLLSSPLLFFFLFNCNQNIRSSIQRILVGPGLALLPSTSSSQLSAWIPNGSNETGYCGRQHSDLLAELDWIGEPVVLVMVSRWREGGMDG